MPDSITILPEHGKTRQTHRFRHFAMATEFELLLIHEAYDYAEQAAYAAFQELNILESQLSRYIENSDISRINHSKINQPVVIGEQAMNCLLLSRDLYLKSGGAFDIALGSRADFLKGKNHQTRPNAERTPINFDKNHSQWFLQIDMTEHTVSRIYEWVDLDLGGIGKGYALDVMSAVLDDWDIKAGMLHGGRSTVVSFGEVVWPVSISKPGKNDQTLLTVLLNDSAISGSGLQKAPHIINPATGNPVSECLAAWSKARTGADADALSTAFMVMNMKDIGELCAEDPATAALVIGRNAEIYKIGDWPENSKGI